MIRNADTASIEKGIPVSADREYDIELDLGVPININSTHHK